MLEGLYAYMNAIHPLAGEVFTDFDKYFEITKVPKHHYLLRQGEVCDFTYIMLEGLARIFYVKNGEEMNSMFVEEKDFFTATDSYYSRKPGDLNIQTLQPAKVARIHYDNLHLMYKKYPDLNFVGRVITENYFRKSEERLTLLRRQSAEERYLFLVEHYPSLIRRIQVKYIASYLGVTFETLSRIRNKISK